MAAAPSFGAGTVRKEPLNFGGCQRAVIEIGMMERTFAVAVREALMI